MSSIGEFSTRIIAGGSLTYDEALGCLQFTQNEDIKALCDASHRVFVHFHPLRADLCSLVNAKSGKCSEDCAFCAQSGHHKTTTVTYPLQDVSTIVERAREAAQSGTHRFCIVTSGGKLSREDFTKVLEAYRQIRATTSLALDGSLGALSDDDIAQLKAVGVTRINHNLETSERYFKSICTTHTFQDRCATIQRLKVHGMEVCSGGIIGMGETAEDRVSMAFSLKELHVECVPINILNPRPGTPLEHAKKLSVDDILKTIAVFRLILPHATIKLAGGREVNLGDAQRDALYAGANGIIIGGYLTTHGNSIATDVALLRSAGFSA